jgi:hypothetical protein
MPDRYIKILSPYEVRCVDADVVRQRYPCRILNGWELKVFGMLHCPFEEVLLLDADCYPVRDPFILFDDPGYREMGAIFWPDTPQSSLRDWTPFRVEPPGLASIESGQVVVNKRQCWRPLQLAWWYNDHSEWSYLHGYGDKHTFEVAWARLGVPYQRFLETAIWLRQAFLHLGPDGRPLFIHCFLPGPTLPFRTMPRFVSLPGSKGLLAEVSYESSGAINGELDRRRRLRRARDYA